MKLTEDRLNILRYFGRGGFRMVTDDMFPIYVAGLVADGLLEEKHTYAITPLGRKALEEADYADELTRAALTGGWGLGYEGEYTEKVLRDENDNPVP